MAFMLSKHFLDPLFSVNGGIVKLCLICYQSCIILYKKDGLYMYSTFVSMLTHHVFKCINLVECLYIIQYI